MATTMFFEGPLKDKEGDGEVSLELGRSSFYDGENLIYVATDGGSVILSEEDGKAFYDAVMRLGFYLGYDKG